jgi:hypothetical protein
MIRVFVGLVALGAVAAVGVTVWTGGVHGPDKGAMTPLPVASPQDSFVVHDAAPAATPTPVPTPTTATPDPAAQSSGLDAVIQRMRAAQPAKPDTLTVTAPAAPGAASSPASGPPAPSATPDTALAGSNPPTSVLAEPNPAPSPLTGPNPPPPEPVAQAPHWSNVTSQGARWRLGRDGSGPALTIDMGGGRVAQVRVLPAFQGLDQAGMNARVDYIKQTILENFPPGSASFVFARDGSITLLR